MAVRLLARSALIPSEHKWTHARSVAPESAAAQVRRVCLGWQMDLVEQPQAGTGKLQQKSNTM